MNISEIIIGTIGLASNYLIYRWLLIVVKNQSKALKIPASFIIFWFFIILGQGLLVIDGFLDTGFGKMFGF